MDKSTTRPAWHGQKKEIARHAGCSVSTIGKILNNKSVGSEELKRRVREITAARLMVQAAKLRETATKLELAAEKLTKI